MLKKRLLSVLLCLYMVAGLLPVVTPTAQAVIMDTHYRVNLSSSAYTSSNPFYQRGFWGECTWYCWGRAMETCGIDIPCRGDAISWYNDAKNSSRSDISVGTTPRENSIVVLEGFPNGHVAFVEKLDGSTAYTTEANVTLNKDKPNEVHYEYYESSFNVNDGKRWGGLETVVGYIYLGGSNPTPPQSTYAAPALDIGNFYARIFNPRSNCSLGNNNGNVELAISDSYDPKQIWQFVASGNGWYKIVNMYDGNCLDAANWGEQNGTNVGLCADNGATAQRWWVCGNSSAIGYSQYFYFIPGYLESQALAMDVCDGGNIMPPGTNIQLWENWYRSSGEFANPQKFNIIKLDYSKPAKPSAPTFKNFSASPERTVISWDAVPTVGAYDNREYILEIWDTVNSRYVLRNQHVTGTYYRLTLPLGSYRAEIQAVNTKYADLKSGWNMSGYFTVYPYRTITLTASPAEGGIVNGDGIYNQNDYTTLQAKPNEGWRFKGWIRNGQPVTDWTADNPVVANYRLTVTRDETFEALFERITPPVSMEVTKQDGTISATILPQGVEADCMVAAAYAPDGSMLSVQTLTYANRTTGDKLEYMFYGLPLDGARYVKVFALDAAQTPLCPSEMIFTGVVQGTIPEPD